MKWEVHDKWAGKLNISEEASQEVNNLIDDVEDTGLNSEFKQNTMSYISAAMDRSDSTLAHVAAERAARHDSGRTQKSDAKLYANGKLNLLRKYGDDYVTAYYLHHYLDYFDEEWKPQKDVDELVEEFRSKYRHLASEEIEQFFQEHKSTLVRDLQ